MMRTKKPLKQFKVGDTIIIHRTGFLCTTYDEFARKHNLTKYEHGYDPSDDVGGGESENDFILNTPVRGRIVVDADTHIGVDLGHRHIIVSEIRRPEYQDDFDIIKQTILDEGLFKL